MSIVGAAVLAATACEPQRPPAPEQRSQDPAAPDPAAATALFDPGAADAVLTYAGERGVFADTSKVDEIPPQAQGLVRVKLLGGEAAPAGMVWVANLRTPPPQGGFTLRTVPRELFEEHALGQGRSSTATLPEGLEAPEQVAAATGVVVYKTSWCGVCKKVEAYLDRKGVEYVAKDIEKDREAASVLKAKSEAQGVRMGSVPVVEVAGQLIVGFDRARLEKLL